MEVVNILHQTNGTFAQSFVLDEWANLYDLSEGHWHCHLRRQLASAIVHYEFSTENGLIEYDETHALGWITFPVNPNSDGSASLTIGSTVIRFGTDVAVGVTLNATMVNLMTFLNGSINPDVLHCTYNMTYDAVLGATLTLIYATAGSLGNAFPIAVASVGATKSGDTLSGGGGTVTLKAPVEDIETFDGDFYYDVRWQVPATDYGDFVPVVGGIITFVRGSTRDTE